MLNITIMVLAVALMIIGYVFRHPSIAIVSAVAWLIFGFYNRTLSIALWDVYYVMFILGICLFFVAFIEGMILRPKIEDTEVDEDIWDREVEEYIARRTKWKERMSRVMDVRVEPKEDRLMLPPPREWRNR